MKNLTLISRVLVLVLGSQVLGLGLGIRVLGLDLGLEAQVVVNITGNSTICKWQCWIARAVAWRVLRVVYHGNIVAVNYKIL